jgi:transposase
MKGSDKMIYAGIDIAKKTHVACVVDHDLDTIVNPFAFDNDLEGFQKLDSVLDSFRDESLLVGLESTAHYGETLINHLLAKGYNLAVINPIQTATLRKTNIRNTKTDSIDAPLVVKSPVVNGWTPFTVHDADIMKLRNLCRFRDKKRKENAKAKIRLKSFVDRVFPELQYFFGVSFHGKTCHELLFRHPRSDEIAALHLTYLYNLLRKASHGRYGKETARQLKSLAKSSVGIRDAHMSLQITRTIEKLRLMEKQLSQLDDNIKRIVIQLDPIILTIPGVGLLNAGMILGEIGNIRRFSNPSKLLAFAGLDPTVRQSGNFNARSTRMSKRGSKLLRYALINASWNVVRNNATFRQYYDLKRAQGKSHYAALGHVAFKLVRVIHKMMKDNIAFNPD